MALFSPYAAPGIRAGEFSDYYNDRAYPLDLNAAQDYTRPAGAGAVFPFPVVIGAVQTKMALMDQLIFDGAVAKTPYGPWVGAPQGAPALAFPRNIFGVMLKEG